MLTDKQNEEIILCKKRNNEFVTCLVECYTFEPCQRYQNNTHTTQRHLVTKQIDNHVRNHKNHHKTIVKNQQKLKLPVTS